MEQPYIVINNVAKIFKEGMVLKDINVCFESGRIHGLVGRNGSGKTMLMKCICGLIPVTSGEIIVNGQRIGKDVDVPCDTGAIIESPGFLPNYSAIKNLKFLAAMQNKIDTKQIKAAIARVGLDPDNNKRVGKYSLGMRQRLGIAQAFMEDQKLLLLDEPLSGLDKSGVDTMRQLFLDLKKEGKTILIATHIAQDIELLCDTVYEMGDGRLSKIS